MAAVNSYIISSAFSKLNYIAVTGGAFCIGEVENKRGKLVFTDRSFEVQLERFADFFRVVRQLGENLIKEASQRDFRRTDKEAANSNEEEAGPSKKLKQRESESSQDQKIAIAAGTSHSATGNSTAPHHVDSSGTQKDRRTPEQQKT